MSDQWVVLIPNPRAYGRNKIRCNRVHKFTEKMLWIVTGPFSWSNERLRQSDWIIETYASEADAKSRYRELQGRIKQPEADVAWNKAMAMSRQRESLLDDLCKELIAKRDELTGPTSYD